jgi:VWFA-related protein
MSPETAEKRKVSRWATWPSRGKSFALSYPRASMANDLRRIPFIAALLAAVVTLQGQQVPAGRPPAPDDAFRFKSGVELINVTATVSDSSGRFVPDLQKEDFIVYEDDRPQTVTHFSAARVPVSLGIALDTSGSMAGDKMSAAQSALDRFLYELIDMEDEIFVYLFSNYPRLLQTWTNDRRLLASALGRITPNGGTAMYDAVAEAVPLAGQGKNRKKALVVISDGNDTSSRLDVREVKHQIRESEVLVYAIGIDGEGETGRRVRLPPRVPIPLPFPFPPGRGRGGRGGWPPQQPPIGGPGGGTGGGGLSRGSRSDDRVNVVALRDMTDDSGGRTEIIRDARDLSPATVSIADELSKQYYLGYPSNGKKDGRWHSIRVEVRSHTYRVRARRGYVAS